MRPDTALLAALHTLRPALETARDAAPAGSQLESSLALLAAARLDVIDEISRLAIPRLRTPIGELIAARQRYDGQRATDGE